MVSGSEVLLETRSRILLLVHERVACRNHRPGSIGCRSVIARRQCHASQHHVRNRLVDVRRRTLGIVAFLLEQRDGVLQIGRDRAVNLGRRGASLGTLDGQIEGDTRLILAAVHVVVLVNAHQVIVSQRAVGQRLSLIYQRLARSIVGNQVEDLVRLIDDLVVTVPAVCRIGIGLGTDAFEHIFVGKPVGQFREHHIVALQIHTQIPDHESAVVGRCLAVAGMHVVDGSLHHGCEHEVGILLDQFAQLLIRHLAARRLGVELARTGCEQEHRSYCDVIYYVFHTLISRLL